MAAYPGRVEVELQRPDPAGRGLAAAVLGSASVALLAASILLAHHWGPVADLLVAAWALSTLGALVVAVWSLRTSRVARAAARFGLAFALVSLTALVMAGVLWAAGVDTAGACGGA